MRAEYDFSRGKRGALMTTKGKTRITIYIDDAVLNEISCPSGAHGRWLSDNDERSAKRFLEKNERPVTAAVLRQVIREEFPEVSRLARRSTGRAKTTRR